MADDDKGSFAVYVQADKSAGAHRTIFAGSESLARAKELCVEAVAKRAAGPGTIGSVCDIEMTQLFKKTADDVPAFKPDPALATAFAAKQAELEALKAQMANPNYGAGPNATMAAK